jgi:hypothetical protein
VLLDHHLCDHVTACLATKATHVPDEEVVSLNKKQLEWPHREYGPDQGSMSPTSACGQGAIKRARTVRHCFI